MKRLMIILLCVGVLHAGIAHAIEHSALSNVFTLDTRRTPMQHSALSNIFTLDTRDVLPSVGLEHSALSNVFTLDIVLLK